MKILVIEDDPVWLLKLKMLADNIKHSTVYTATSLAHTRQLLNEIEFDVVIADICLPDGDATKFFQPMSVCCPIIFLTNYPRTEYVEESLTLPQATFIVKPFHELTLVAQIKKNAKRQDESQDTKQIEVLGKYRQHIPIMLKDIIYIEAEGNYVSINVAERNHVMKNSLRKLWPSLDERFVQIQKSMIVNTKFINRFDAHQSCVILRDSKPLAVGRIYKKDLVQKLEK